MTDHDHADAIGRICAIEITYRGCKGRAYWDSYSEIYRGNVEVPKSIAFFGLTPEDTRTQFIDCVNYYLSRGEIASPSDIPKDHP
jgi:hypothetical protein